jgi:hypothetical protein
MKIELADIAAQDNVQLVGGKIYLGPPSRALLGEQVGSQLHLTPEGEAYVAALASKLTGQAIADSAPEHVHEPADYEVVPEMEHKDPAKKRGGRPRKDNSALDHDGDGKMGGDAGAKHHKLELDEVTETTETFD